MQHNNCIHLKMMSESFEAQIGRGFPTQANTSNLNSFSSSFLEHSHNVENVSHDDIFGKPFTSERISPSDQNNVDHQFDSFQHMRSSSPEVAGSASLSMPVAGCMNAGFSDTGGAVVGPKFDAHAKIEELKNWTMSTYKCTKQAIQEKLGKTTRTVDVEIEQLIEELRNLQQRYSSILRHSRLLASHYHHVVEAQASLGEAFGDLVEKESSLKDEFAYSCETQRTLAKEGRNYLQVLNFFVSSINTMVNKTIEDTMETIKHFESARLEYDAYRTDLELLQQSTVRSGDFQSRLHSAQQQCELHKQRYEQLRNDVQVKIRFLHENKTKVLQKQLFMLQNATRSFFSGNRSALDSTLQQFNIGLKTPSNQVPSFLEQ